MSVHDQGVVEVVDVHDQMVVVAEAGALPQTRSQRVQQVRLARPQASCSMNSRMDQQSNSWDGFENGFESEFSEVRQSLVLFVGLFVDST